MGEINVVFLTGYKNPLKINDGERRFSVAPPETNEGEPKSPIDTVIEFAGAIWHKGDGGTPVYRTSSPASGDCYVRQYIDQHDDYDGKWHWGSEFNILGDFKPTVIEQRVAGIKDTIDEAMTAAMNARALFRQDILRAAEHIHSQQEWQS